MPALIGRQQDPRFESVRAAVGRNANGQYDTFYHHYLVSTNVVSARGLFGGHGSVCDSKLVASARDPRALAQVLIATSLVMAHTRRQLIYNSAIFKCVKYDVLRASHHLLFAELSCKLASQHLIRLNLFGQ